ncbi:uncharacterized protein K489DRAFT_374122 [Dissoconium aciculare CBS 342.82]|uniref:Uncharacterized protein n=1 Tax=Dissoconium aciculare CBS 342.82 TaxID=1314786 RepID=A0A6J3LU14_9PEZI|nr:uncharacterized protein K489DRAFT_374122 [Dissoconium aciculare CBS 342.82]KAF1818769.1 hypothetical protein K489DRAFT_374122 [Dissoconium aciculare CBS 342.82]
MSVHAEPIPIEPVVRRSEAVANCATEVTVTVTTIPSYCLPPATTISSSPPPPPPSPTTTGAEPSPPMTTPSPPSTYGLPPSPPPVTTSVSTPVSSPPVPISPEACTVCTTWVETVTIPSDDDSSPPVTTIFTSSAPTTGPWGWGATVPEEKSSETTSQPMASVTSSQSSVPNKPYQSITTTAASPSHKPSYTKPSDGVMSMPNDGVKVAASLAFIGIPLVLALF